MRRSLKTTKARYSPTECTSSIVVNRLSWDGLTYSLFKEIETASDYRPVNTDSALLVKDRVLDGHHAGPVGIGRVLGHAGELFNGRGLCAFWTVVYGWGWFRLLHNSLPGMQQRVAWAVGT